jgi:hypothetical protein
VDAAEGSSVSSWGFAAVEPANGSSTSTVLWILLALAGFGVAAWSTWSLVMQLQRRRAASVAGGEPRPAAPPMPGSVPVSGPHAIFVCYRRADSADVAGRIYQELDGRFGRSRLFKDIDA